MPVNKRYLAVELPDPCCSLPDRGLYTVRVRDGRGGLPSFARNKKGVPAVVSEYLPLLSEEAAIFVKRLKGQRVFFVFHAGKKNTAEAEAKSPLLFFPCLLPVFLSRKGGKVLSFFISSDVVEVSAAEHGRLRFSEAVRTGRLQSESAEHLRSIIEECGKFDRVVYMFQKTEAFRSVEHIIYVLQNYFHSGSGGAEDRCPRGGEQILKVPKSMLLRGRHSVKKKTVRNKLFLLNWTLLSVVSLFFIFLLSEASAVGARAAEAEALPALQAAVDSKRKYVEELGLIREAVEDHTDFPVCRYSFIARELGELGAHLHSIRIGRNFFSSEIRTSAPWSVMRHIEEQTEEGSGTLRTVASPGSGADMYRLQWSFNDDESVSAVSE